MMEMLPLIPLLASAVAVVASLLARATEARDMPALQPIPVSVERDAAARDRTPRNEN